LNLLKEGKEILVHVEEEKKERKKRKKERKKRGSWLIGHIRVFILYWYGGAHCSPDTLMPFPLWTR